MICLVHIMWITLSNLFIDGELYPGLLILLLWVMPYLLNRMVGLKNQPPVLSKYFFHKAWFLSKAIIGVIPNKNRNIYLVLSGLLSWFIFIFPFYLWTAHIVCLELTDEMVPIIKTYPWQCMECKTCVKCKDAQDEVSVDCTHKHTHTHIQRENSLLA